MVRRCTGWPCLVKPCAGALWPGVAICVPISVSPGQHGLTRAGDDLQHRGAANSWRLVADLLPRSHRGLGYERNQLPPHRRPSLPRACTPGYSDAVRRLGELERAIMDVLWESTEPLTVRQVGERLTDRELAHTTVMTVLDRLAKKGFARRERDGRAWRYCAAADREAYVP